MARYDLDKASVINKLEARREPYWGAPIQRGLSVGIRVLEDGATWIARAHAEDKRHVYQSLGLKSATNTYDAAKEAAASAAQAAGLEAHILSDEIEGESREVGKVHAAMARAVARGAGAWKKPCVILSGGETTVTIRKQPEGTPRGRGGRAGEFCMGLAQTLQGHPGVFALAADTDGIDGVEDNAGAYVAPNTLARAQQQGMKIDQYLDRNDAYGYFNPLGDLVITGPTHTNVNDFRAMLIL